MLLGGRPLLPPVSQKKDSAPTCPPPQNSFPCLCQNVFVCFHVDLISTWALLKWVLSNVSFKYLGDQMSVVNSVGRSERGWGEIGDWNNSLLRIYWVGCSSHHVNANCSWQEGSGELLEEIGEKFFRGTEWLLCLCSRSGMLEAGVDRIISQVVDPKLNHIFRPQIERAIHEFLAAQKKEESVPAPPPEPENKDPPAPSQDAS